MLTAHAAESNSAGQRVTFANHFAQVNDLPAEVAGRLMIVATGIVAALRRSSIQCDGFNIVLSDGRVAGQEVFHTHLHVIPRHEDDGHRRVFFPRDPEPRSRDDLDGVTAEVRQWL